MPTRPGLLDCIERYFAAAPLPDARIRPVGGLDVPIGDPAWPYPARPRGGVGPVTVDDVREATALLSEKWGETEILAGGTDLVTSLKQHLTTPKRVVSLRNISELKGIQTAGKTLRIGATATLGELAAHKEMKQHFPALVTAAEGVGSPQLLSVGTVGGDLCQRSRCWYFRNGFGLFGKDGGTSLVREGDNRYHAIFGNDGEALFVSPSSLGPALIALDATLVRLVLVPSALQLLGDRNWWQPKPLRSRAPRARPERLGVPT